MKKQAFILFLVLALALAPCALTESDTWDCPTCGRTGNTRKFCTNCGTARPVAHSDTVEADRDETTEEEAVMPSDNGTDEKMSTGPSGPVEEWKGLIEGVDYDIAEDGLLVITFLPSEAEFPAFAKALCALLDSFEPGKTQFCVLSKRTLDNLGFESADAFNAELKDVGKPYVVELSGYADAGVFLLERTKEGNWDVEWLANALAALELTETDLPLYICVVPAEHEHVPETVAGRAATCTQEGLTDGVICSLCGEVLQEQAVIPKAEHTPVTVAGTPATCTKTGLTDGAKCAVCGVTLEKQKTIAKTAHTRLTVHGYAATCTENGLSDGVKCSVCGTVLEKQITIPATGHKRQIVKGYAATSTTAGKTDGVICSTCKAVLEPQQDIPIPTPHQHTAKAVSGYAATCTTAGKTDGSVCATCGATLKAQQDIPAKGHTPVTVKGTAATCEAAGKTDGSKCADCGITITAQTTIPAKGHTEVSVAGKAATCTATGLTDGKKCSVCGKILVAQTTIAKLPHSEVTIAGKAATCTATGLTDGKKCSVCGQTLVAQTTIAKLPHTEVTIAGKAATCTATGLTDGKKCSVCGQTLVSQTTIAKLPHTEVTVAGKAATCTATGKTDGTKCSVCGTIIQAQTDIPKTAHTPITVPGYAATCTKAGKTDGTKCSVCGTIIEAQNDIPASHNWSMVHGTLSGQVGHWYQCSVCYATRDFSEHTYGAWEVTLNPSCGSQGQEKRACTICGAYQSRYTEPTGNHSWTLQSGSLSGQNGHWYQCSVCYATKDFAAHTPSYVSISSAQHKVICTVCGTHYLTLSHNFANGVCSDCGYASPTPTSQSTATSTEHDHVYTYTSVNTSDHRRTCSICGYTDQVPHNYPNTFQYNDTKGHYRFCTTCGCENTFGYEHNLLWACGSVNGVPSHYKYCSSCRQVIHRYDGEHPADKQKYDYDKNGHCWACGWCRHALSAYESHSFVDGVCSVCGYKQT